MFLGVLIRGVCAVSYWQYALKPEQLMQIAADLELTKEHQSLKALQTIQSGVIDAFPQLSKEVTKLLELLQTTEDSLHVRLVLFPWAGLHHLSV